MADEETNREAFRIQAHYCRANASPIYAALCDALADGLTRGSRTGVRVRWPQRVRAPDRPRRSRG